MPGKAEREKEMAAACALEFIESGMTVGLGTGSTASAMIRQLGDRVARGLKITGIPTSEDSHDLAAACGIHLKTLQEVSHIDINIDGADAFNNELQLLKGGGGALLHEKIIASASRQNIIIVDSAKYSSDLAAAFPLAIEVVPLATRHIATQLKERGLSPTLRQSEDGLFLTQEGNYILDLDISGEEDLPLLDSYLHSLPGLVETGLFLGIADRVIMGVGDTTEIFTRQAD